MSPKVKQFIRYTIAVLCSYLLGNVLAIPFALIIDLVEGKEVTGMQWELSFPNLLYNAIIGFFCGFCASKIAGRRGVVIAIIAQLFPLFAFIAFEIAINRDISSTMQVKPSAWTYAGLLPAMLGGYVGSRFSKQIFTSIGVMLASAVMFATIGCGIALHIYTVYIAYQMSGVFMAILAFGSPIVAEIITWMVSWYESGNFVNGYSQWCMLYVVLLVLQGVVLYWITKMEEQKERSQLITSDHMDDAV